MLKLEKIKNKIITISGEPVSGKSTVVRELKNKYEEMGYNVHIISVGDVFRDCIKKEYMKKYPEKKNVNLADMQNDKEFMAKVHSVDGKVDNEVQRKGKEINEKERPNEVYIIDSRLAWKNIPDSYAVRLTINDNIAGKRVLNDKTRSEEDQYQTLESAIEKTRERKIGEIERYKERYNVDLSDEENYNLVVDTSYSNTEELADIIIKGEELYRNGKWYPKNWSSPVCFLPLQLGKITGRPSMGGFTIESLTEIIEKNGFDPELGFVEIVERDNCKYLSEGNHRTFAALSTGKTLLPYMVTSKEDSKIYTQTGITHYDTYKEYVYDYADGIRYYGGKIGKIKQFEKFEVNDLLAFHNMKSIKETVRNDEGR